MATAESSKALSPEALNRLIESRELFLAFLRKRVDSQEVAEDILQAAFVKSIEKGGSLRDEETVIAWFYRLLRNTVIDYYRSKGTSQSALDQLAKEMQGHQEPNVVVKGEICSCVSGLLKTLKPEYQQALNTVDLQERSLAELAGLAQITENNAAVRIHRARQALRKQVTTTCGMCATHGCVDCTCKSKK